MGMKADLKQTTAKEKFDLGLYCLFSLVSQDIQGKIISTVLLRRVLTLGRFFPIVNKGGNFYNLVCKDLPEKCLL